MQYIYLNKKNHLLFALCLHMQHGESGSCHLNCWQTPLLKQFVLIDIICKQAFDPIYYGNGFNILPNLEMRPVSGPK